jgi:hypothetical protein
MFLGAATLLPWAKVSVYDPVLHSRVDYDSATVTGTGTVWGILTFIMAVVAIALTSTEVSTQRLLSAWAVIPGAAAVALTIGFLIRRHHLHTKIPSAGKLTDKELRQAGWALHIAIVPGCYVAPVAALAVAGLALTCIACGGGTGDDGPPTQEGQHPDP